jgi:SRSO17 transposase
MADRLGVDHQRLQQFVSSSIGVSVHLVTDAASAAVNWRLFVPQSWDDTTATDPVEATRIRARRARSKIPDEVRHVEKWRLDLDMLDEMITDWGLPADRPVVADSGYGDATGFRLGLTARGLTYAVAVKPTASAYPADAVPVAPPYAGRGRPPAPRYRTDPANLRALAMAAGRGALRQVTWRHGTRRTKGNPTAKMRSRFLTLRVRPAHRDIPRGDDGVLPACWLLAEWPPGEDEPTDYWLSTLPETTSVKTLVRLGECPEDSGQLIK